MTGSAETVLAISGPLDWSLLTGLVPKILLVLGIVALVVLVASRARAWWLWQVWLVAAIAVGLTVGVGLFVDRVWQPFPDDLANQNLYWIAVGLFGVGLAVGRFAGWGWWARVGSLGLLVLVVAMAANQINGFYGYYPTTRYALGLEATTPLATGTKADVVAPPANGSLESVWHAPADMPAQGSLASNVVIPGTKSGFQPRGAFVYTPPAYNSAPRALLPVLILMHGQPGDPSNWVSGGQIVSTMDAYASRHHGLAPVVVMPDVTGGGDANPMCMNSRLGQMQTYLSEDVPDWIRSTLQVDTDPKVWAVAGLSYGGTCSLQLALNVPQQFPTFLDMSGQDEPTLGTREQTVQAAFGGDEAAFEAVNPADLMRTHKYPGTAGVFTGGRDDSEFTPQQQKIYGEAKAAGLDVRFELVDGSHDFTAWNEGLDSNLDWLGQRMHIT